MHEVGLMQDALEIVIDHARKADARRIRKIRLRVGEDSGVVPDSLQFAFQTLCRQTIAKGARLEIEPVAVRCLCGHCGLIFTPGSVFYECPACERPAVEILSGREFELVSVEVD